MKHRHLGEHLHDDAAQESGRQAEARALLRELFAAGAPPWLPRLLRARGYRLESVLAEELGEDWIETPSLPPCAWAIRRGWIDQNDLARMLQISHATVNVQLCRARKALGEVRDDLDTSVVERRHGVSPLRFGIEPGEIVRG